MPRFEAPDAELTILTFKDGLLSPIAHDLRLTAADISIELEEGRVVGLVKPDSLSVACARKDGRDDLGTLKAKDKAKIAKTMRDEVLKTDRYPEIRFESESVEREDDALLVRGSLTLGGQTRELETRVIREGNRWAAKFDIHQPDFRIKPYTAAFGTLKVKPTVQVEVRIPVDPRDSVVPPPT